MKTSGSRDVVARFSSWRLASALALLVAGFAVAGFLADNPSIFFSRPNSRGPTVLLPLFVAWLLYATSRTVVNVVEFVRFRGESIFAEDGSLFCVGARVSQVAIGAVEHVRIEPPLKSAELGAAFYKLTIHLADGSHFVVPIFFWKTKRSEAVAAFERLGVPVAQDAPKDQLAK